MFPSSLPAATLVFGTVEDYSFAWAPWCNATLRIGTVLIRAAFPNLTILVKVREREGGKEKGRQEKRKGGRGKINK